ncbi:major capsid protein [Yersinia pseudotuberculosis]|uniref:Major capsid protein E n=1 Tax=Yersinia pseudotuberculosis serotype O:3 (strain YPIII) TaxID=502800 RepID=A0A0H3B5K2_YERPY|nr:major capsid protein [Yersinia pseudotuberculosis]AJJ58429.1 phage major capsid E family protein [Yersinia pseudotuberculosis YPIII]AYW88994.1 major capsid protein [Yersinia pseudotuberculosis]AYW99742.1 major capsid protein [Yersinia pseudotuberculosis]AZA31305.1 major capsid protein [Yersinia pseudotuberculosis]MBK1423896.1 major capsid protein [Yersinia pseudotuberculosis]
MNIYDTNVLVGLVPNLKTSQNWLLDRFFPNVVTYETEEVSIDVDIGKRRMSPFVSPLVEGKLVESRKYQTNTFKPAYIKDKRAPDLRKPIRRQMGERIGGEYTAAEREMLNIQFEMEDQIDMLNRRLEWMAASALTKSQITVVGEGFPTTVIDFGRSSNLTITLSGSDKWPLSVAAGTTNTQPSDGIEDWQTLMLKESGAVATDLVFTTASWKAFRLDTTIKDNAITFPALSPFGNQVDAGPRANKGAVYKGRWGNFDLWLYNDWFIDPADGVEKPMIPNGAVLMGSADLMGTRAFGVILDPEFNYGPLAFAPKSWIMPDPAQRYLLMQSAPLVIPSRVNASLCATVV